MKCNKCGKTIDIDSKYCSYCGEMQKEKTITENKKAPSDAKIALIVLGILGTFFLLFIILIIFCVVHFMRFDESTPYNHHNSSNLTEKYSNIKPQLQ